MTEKFFPWMNTDAPESVAIDGYPLFTDDPYFEYQIVLSQMLSEIYTKKRLESAEITEARELGFLNYGMENWNDYPTINTILISDRKQKVNYLFACLYRLYWRRGDIHGLGSFICREALDADAIEHMVIWHVSGVLESIICYFLGLDLPLAENEAVLLVKALSNLPPHRVNPRKILSLSIKNIEKIIEEFGPTKELIKSVAEFKLGWIPTLASDSRKSMSRIDEILGNFPKMVIEKSLVNLPILERNKWRELIKFSCSDKSSEPTKKWLRNGEKEIEKVSRVAFKVKVESCLIEVLEESYLPVPFTQDESSLLIGLIWLCSLVQDDGLIQVIADFAESCFRKIPNYGQRSPKVGNACLYTLSMMPPVHSISQLERLRQKIKNKATEKVIEKALNRAAERAGLSREDLAERMVPTYGLNLAGELQERLGSFTAQVRLVGTQGVELTWIKPDGKAQKSVPAEIKRDFAAEWKALKRMVDELPKTLQTQRDRLENLYLYPRAWDYQTWRDRYLSHPLLAHIAHKLIWCFQLEDRVELGIWQEGQFVDPNGHCLSQLTAQTQVSLWHPINSSAAIVLNWRTWLENHQIVQPFKQAHREVYLLTDAERETALYSNRFAAHILKQHQFAALCKHTDWSYSLQGNFDGYNTPIRQLPQADLRIEYWVEPIESEQSAAGIYLYISTDQVRFCNLQGEPQPLTSIPPLIFSEVMRNIDLFVGVASVGNDPQWHDRGLYQQFDAYWQEYSFGELSSSARIRKDVLQRLLPRLKIGDRCTVTDKFLIVQGQLRTYKIHLGSSNILMELNDQYLCIVPDRNSQPLGQVFLPFEGDSTLALILSKAFLLADDSKIKDSSILRQIRL